MIDKIKILPQELSNKIAAGEVIERPASVVKELVENAIDAGSDRISVEVKLGGKQLISVVDNGRGMTRQNAVLAFERHATSKIGVQEDLFRIATFGFSGEALSSLASVAKVDLTTKNATEEVGTRLRIDGEGSLRVTDSGRADGTTILVSQLFYNVPARRKFLRTTATETRHIVSTISTMAMAYPEITFSLLVDGRETLSLPSVSNVYARAQVVMGNTVMNQMIPVTFEDELVKIYGFISRPDSARVSRTHQYLFINTRPVSSRALNHAVFEGYGSILPKERYPVSIIFLTIDLGEVDVNVHPSKREIKFSDESKVYERVLRAIRLALQNSDVVPIFETDTQDITTMIPAAGVDKSQSVNSTIPHENLKQTDLFSLRPLSAEPTFSSPWSHKQNQTGQDQKFKEQKDLQTYDSDADLISLWQLHSTYICAQIKDGFVLIDQHGAHERVLFERALKTLNEESGSSQQLLFPVTMDLMASQFALVQEYFDLFENLGFSLKIFGERTIVIDAVPSFSNKQVFETLFQHMIENLQETPLDNPKMKERIAATFSSHGGIRKGDALSQREMNMLVNDLFATEMPYVTPGGRPVIIRIPFEEIERRFNKK